MIGQQFMSREQNTLFSPFFLPPWRVQHAQCLHRQAGSRLTSGQLVSLTWSHNRRTVRSGWACGIRSLPVHRTERNEKQTNKTNKLYLNA